MFSDMIRNLCLQMIVITMLAPNFSQENILSSNMCDDKKSDKNNIYQLI